jgi:hypothetical protein
MARMREARVPGAPTSYELGAEDDHNGAAIWRLITDAVAQLANTTPSGPVN